MSTEHVSRSRPSAAWHRLDLPRNTQITLIGLVVLLVAGLVTHLILQTNGTYTGLTTLDTPVFLRAMDSGFNVHDFYTNAIADTPRDGFVWMIRPFTLLGVDWLTVISWHATASAMARPLLTFAIFVMAAHRASSEAQDTRLLLPAYLLAAATILVTFAFPGFYHPGGWYVGHAVTNIAGSHYAVLLSLILTLMILHAPARGYPAKIALAGIITFIHPAIGLGIWSWLVPLMIWLSPSLKVAAQRCAMLGIGVAAAIVLTLSLYAQPKAIDVETFREIYAYWRHPFHYQMSFLWPNANGFWFTVVALLGGAIVAARFKDKRIVLMLLGFLGVFLGALGLQWVGTDLFPTRSVIQLGPTRFTSHTALYGLIGLIVVAIHRYASVGTRRPDPELTIFPERPTRTLAIAGAAALLVAAPIKATYAATMPPDDPIITWLQDNTAPDDVVQDMHMGPYFLNSDGIWVHYDHVTFSIRDFAERPIFADKAFPFKEDTFVEFRDRLQVAKRLAQTPVDNVMCDTGGYRLDYLIYNSKTPTRPLETNPIVQSGDWSLYSAEQFPCPEAP